MWWVVEIADLKILSEVLIFIHCAVWPEGRHLFSVGLNRIALVLVQIVLATMEFKGPICRRTLGSKQGTHICCLLYTPLIKSSFSSSFLPRFLLNR